MSAYIKKPDSLADTGLSGKKLSYFILNTLPSSRTLPDSDGNGVRLDGMAGAVLNNTVEFDAVPCGIGQNGFTGVGSALPE